MWRVSSVAITAIPIFIPLMFALATWLENGEFDTIGFIAILSIFLAGLLYIIAWVFTLVLALTSLRDLPPGAFDTVPSVKPTSRAMPRC